MAMRWFCSLVIAIVTLCACSNSSDFETGEIKAIKMLKETWLSSRAQRVLLDTRDVVTRKKINDANIPVLFVELENGQNGTLTLYPGQGVGETWLGADGATITLRNGILKATRGMKNDLMGGTSSMPSWSEIKESISYKRIMFYLDGNNKITKRNFTCQIEKNTSEINIIIFDAPFRVIEYSEACVSDVGEIKNFYLVDTGGIVRKSLQYHGPALGYLDIERLDLLR